MGIEFVAWPQPKLLGLSKLLDNDTLLSPEQSANNREQLRQELLFLKSNLFQYDQALFSRIEFFIDEQLAFLDGHSTFLASTDNATIDQTPPAPSVPVTAVTPAVTSIKIQLLSSLVKKHKNLMMRLALLTLEHNDQAPLSYQEFLQINAKVLDALCQEYENLSKKTWSKSLNLLHHKVRKTTHEKELRAIIVRFLPKKLQKSYREKLIKPFHYATNTLNTNSIITTDLYQHNPILCDQYLELLLAQHLVTNETTGSSSIVKFFDEYMTLTQATQKVLVTAKNAQASTTNTTVLKLYDLLINTLFKMLHDQHVIEQATLQSKTDLLKACTLICADQEKQGNLACYTKKLKKIIDNYFNPSVSASNLLYHNIYPLTLQLQQSKKIFEASTMSKVLFTQEKSDQYHRINMMIELLKNVALEIKKITKDTDSYHVFDQVFSENWPDYQASSKNNFFSTLTTVADKLVGKPGTWTENALQSITPVLTNKLISKLIALTDSNDEQDNVSTKETSETAPV